SVVVGAVVNVLGAFREAARPAVAEVIVVSADHKDFLRERPMAVKNGDDILNGDHRSDDMRFDGRSPSFERTAARLEVTVDRRFYFLERHSQATLEDRIDGRSFDVDARYSARQLRR